MSQGGAMSGCLASYAGSSTVSRETLRDFRARASDSVRSWIRLGSVGVTDTARLFTGAREERSSAAVTSSLDTTGRRGCVTPGR